MRSHATRALALSLVAGLVAQAQAADPGVFVDTRADGTIVSDASGNRAVVRNVVQSRDTDAKPTLPAPESETTWSALGPFGGDVAAIGESPDVAGLVLVGLAPNGSIGGTLYRSTDGGATWAEATQLTGQSVYDIIYLPGGDILIGAQDDLWRSTDNGLSWNKITVGSSTLDFFFDIDRDAATGTLYAAGRVAIGGGTANVLASTDNGATWSDISPFGAAGLDGSAIRVNPANSSELMATFQGAFGGGAVFFSSNGGASWQDRSAGLTGNPVLDVEIVNDLWYIAGGQRFGSQFLGVYRSGNDGATWDRLSDATWPSEIARDVAIDPDNPQRLLAASPEGLHVSTDGGDTWQIASGNSGNLSLTALAYAPADSNRVWIGGDSIGSAVSPDDGATINLSNSGIGALDIYGVAIDPSNGDNLALAFQALNSGGIYTSTDGGATWSLESGLPPSRYNAVFFAPDGTLYALNDGPTSGGVLEGVYRQNSPNNWTPLGPDQGPLFESELFAMAFGIANPDLIFVGGSDFGVAGFEPTVWRSNDAGATWTKTYEPAGRDFEDVTAIAIANDGVDGLAIASYIDTSSAQTGGAISTSDGGASWTEASSGLSADAQGYDVALIPGTTDTFLLGDGDNATTQGLYQSIDAGESWVPVQTGINIRGIAIDPDDANNRYTWGFAAPIARRSASAGAPLDAFTDGLAGITTARDITAASGRVLLAARGGVFTVDLPGGSGGCSLADLSSPASPGVPDGLLSGADFFEFLSRFGAGDLSVDFSSPANPGTPDGLLSGADFFEFLSLFAAGC